MPLPILLVIVGQQIFRMAATAAAKKAIKAVGGRIVKEVPKAFAKKRVGSENAFTKLVKEKKPALQDKIGNLFTKKSKKVTQKSTGRVNKKEGIIAGVDRFAATGRGNIVLGATAVGVPSVLGLATLYKKLQQARTETARVQAQKDIDNAVAKVVVANEKAKNKSSAPSKSKRPQTRKTLAPSKSQRPKIRSDK